MHLVISDFNFWKYTYNVIHFIGKSIFNYSRLDICLFVFFVFFFVCLEFAVHSKIIIWMKGCKFLPMLGTYGHWAVRVLACPTYCYTGHPFIMVISEDPWHSLLMPSVKQWSCHYLFKRLRSFVAGIVCVCVCVCAIGDASL